MGNDGDIIQTNTYRSQSLSNHCLLDETTLKNVFIGYHHQISMVETC